MKHKLLKFKFYTDTKYVYIKTNNDFIDQNVEIYNLLGQKVYENQILSDLGTV